MDRELLIQTLYRRLTRPPLVYGFTANTAVGSAVLGNIADPSGLVLRMPLGGAGIPEGAVIATVAPEVTIGKFDASSGEIVPIAATANGADVPITQGFQTFSRRRKALTEIFPQPAFFLVDGPAAYPSEVGTLGRRSNEPARIILEPKAYIYTNLTDASATPSSVLNVLLDQIEKALDPPPDAPNGVWQNLGLTGVHYARIQGAVTPQYVTLTGQIVCTIPIAIQVIQSFETVPLVP